MTKKKKPQQPLLSPKRYVCLRARSLPITKCYINKNWHEIGTASILVVRQHQSGNYTSGQYLVDTFCLGLKTSAFDFKSSPEEMEDIINKLPECIEISYNEIHNIIFGAITFAEEEAGISPDKNFEFTQYLLEEDTEDIPLIEYEFGHLGSPLLVVNTRAEANKYLPKLRQKLGEDARFIIREEEDDFYDELDDEDGYMYTTYDYDAPPYPATMNLTHPEVNEIFNHPEYANKIPPHIIEEILSLPRESLIADLNQLILYELGKYRKICITGELYDSESSAMTHAFFFLGELEATESLQTILEVLRQDEQAIDELFGFCPISVIRLTLYYIGRNQMEAMLAFMKEPGLTAYNRSQLLMAVTTIVLNDPERREEIIEWYRQLIRFFIENMEDNTFFDSELSASIILELIEIRATELLPEIEELFDTDQVQIDFCGEYSEVKEELFDAPKASSRYTVVDIYQRYEEFDERIE